MLLFRSRQLHTGCLILCNFEQDCGVLTEHSSLAFFSPMGTDAEAGVRKESAPVPFLLSLVSSSSVVREKCSSETVCNPVLRLVVCF